MNKIQLLSFLMLCFFMTAFVWSEESQSFAYLLENYLANDRSLKEIELQYEQALLSYKKTQVQNSLSISLSSGTSVLSIDENGTDLSLAPSLSLGLPEFQNTKTEVKFPMTLPLKENASPSIQDAGLSLSMDIISSAKKNRELVIKKAEESLRDASQKKEARTLAVKKEFLQSLKSIYTLQSNLLTQEDNALTKEVDLSLLKMQGFAESSAKYRLAYLSWQSVLRDYEEAKRSFEKEVLDFARKCNVEKLDLFIDLPREELVDISEFPKTSFSAIKTSIQNYENNSLAEKAKSPFTLALNAGYGFSLSGKEESRTVKNTLSSGLTFKKDGLSASLGMQNNLEKIENPRFTFSLSYSFLEQALSTIAVSEDEVQEKILMQAIENAELTYNSTVQDKQKQKDDLLWQLQKNKDQEALYADLAEDMKTWYDKGIISTSEYKQALTNYTKASTQVRISEIDGIIYNIDTALLFY